MGSYSYGEFEGYDGPYSLELDYEPYQSYEVGVWFKGGALYLGTDSTCSCYTPFESYSVGELTGPLTYEQAEEEITSIWKDARRYASNKNDPGLTEFLSEIKEKTNGNR